MDIVKVVGAIWTRLFDHKVFLSGELQFTLREYEQKRADSEVENLFTLLEKLTDFKDTQLPRANSFETDLTQINCNLNNCLSICNQITDLETKYQESTVLDLAREDRHSQWEKFVDDITYSCSQLDNTFLEKEEELQEFYCDLERKLNIDKRLS